MPTLTDGDSPEKTGSLEGLPDSPKGVVDWRRVWLPEREPMLSGRKRRYSPKQQSRRGPV
jgi:hypothetical protein